MKRLTGRGTLEERLQRVEDYIEIVQLLSAYGPAADATHWELLKEIWAEDCVYETSIGSFHGHDGLWQAFSSDFHRDLERRGSGHINVSPYVVIEGDRASATQHGWLFRHTDGAFPVAKLFATRWELERRDDRWVVVRRINEQLAENQAARDLLARLDDDLPPGRPAGDAAREPGAG